MNKEDCSISSTYKCTTVPRYTIGILHTSGTKSMCSRPYAGAAHYDQHVRCGSAPLSCKAVPCPPPHILLQSWPGKASPFLASAVVLY